MLTIKLQRNSLYVRLIFVLILLTPVIDTITGYFTAVLNYSGITPGVVYKGMVVFPVFFWFCLRGNSRVLRFFFIGVFVILIGTAYSLVNSNNVEIVSSLSGYLKIIYPFLGYGAIKYIHERKISISARILWKLGYYVGLITAIGVVAFSFSGIQVQNYRDASYTSSGLYQAGNDTGLLILISFCFFLYYNRVFQKKKNMMLIVVSIIYGYAVFLLSTRATLLGLPLTLLLVLGYMLFSRRQRMPSANKAFLVVALGLFSFLAINTINYLVESNQTAGIDRFQKILSDEDQIRYKLDDGLAIIGDFNVFEHLFGIGENNFPLIENDLVDIYGGYGFIFLIGLVGVILYFLLTSYRKFIATKGLMWLTLSTILTFYVFHGAIAGHAYASGQVNSIMLIVYFLVCYYKNETQSSLKG